MRAGLLKVRRWRLLADVVDRGHADGRIARARGSCHDALYGERHLRYVRNVGSDDQEHVLEIGRFS